MRTADGNDCIVALGHGYVSLFLPGLSLIQHHVAGCTVCLDRSGVAENQLIVAALQVDDFLVKSGFHGAENGNVTLGRLDVDHGLAYELIRGVGVTCCVNVLFEGTAVDVDGGSAACSQERTDDGVVVEIA